VEREVQIMAQLDYPNIVRYYDSWFNQQPPEFFQDDPNYDAVGRSVDSSIAFHVSPSPSSSSSSSSSTSSSASAAAASPLSSPLSSSLSSSSSSRSNPRDDETYLYIQMELCRTGTLADWLDKHRKRRPPVKTCVEIVQSVVKAVDYLHDNNCMHRDIKVGYNSTFHGIYFDFC